MELGRRPRATGRAARASTARAGLFATCRAYLTGRLEAARAAGVLGPGRVDPMAELLVRVVLSFVLIDDTVLDVDDDASARDIARRYLAPVLAPP